LAKRQKAGVTTITEVAAVQAIPPRFLEVVLAELKRGGFVESRRGVRGG
jgi:DNA-binding IscR family transcriptional regulator